MHTIRFVKYTLPKTRIGDPTFGDWRGLRVAADRTLEGAGPGEDAAARHGSVYTDLDVPDFTRERLAVSGLVLNASRPIVSGPRDALAAVLPILPTTAREFGEDDRVTGFLRLYQGGDRAPIAVSVTTRVVDGKNLGVSESSQTIGGERFTALRAADVQFKVPIAGLPPGPYLLSVEARAGNVTAKREVRLAIR